MSESYTVIIERLGDDLRIKESELMELKHVFRCELLAPASFVAASGSVVFLINLFIT